MNEQRRVAKYSGYSLILMAIIAGFSFGYALPKIFEINQLELVQKNLTENLELYKFMLFGILLIILLDIIVSFTLYYFFRTDSYQLSFASLILRLIYTIIFGISIYFLYANLEAGIDNSHIKRNYYIFQNIWNLGLIIFGVHLLVLGILIKKHESIPKFIWLLTMFAGFSYIVLHSLKIIQTDSKDIIEQVNNFLALPMALGELVLAIWLIAKGGKISK